MDSADPQGSPGVNHEDGITGRLLTSTETDIDLDGWTSTTDLNEVQKDVPSASRLLFLTVEYVEEHASDYGRSAFAGFEPGTPFSLQPPTSLSEFEHRVSPLDPNMGSTARYSPVFTINGNSDSLSVSREISSSSTTVSSNPSSPFPSQVVVLTNPSSPLMNTPPDTSPASPSFTENSHEHSPLSNSVVSSADISQGFVNHMLSNPVPSPITCTSSSTDGEGLLRQVVADDNYFNQQASSTTGSVLSGGLGGSPLNPNSPHSPLQAPLTPADNYVVSSSTETLDTMGPRPSDFHSDATVSVASSPGVVDSTSEIMIHSSMQQATEIVGATDASPFHNLESAGVMSTTHDVQLKHDPLDRVQLLISSSDGSIAYSLDGDTSFMPTRLVDMGNELLSHRASDEQNLNSVMNSFKSQGLVIGERETGDLQLRPSETEDTNAEEKLAGTLGLQDFTLAVRQQNEILQQTLLAAPLNGDLTDSVAHLGESLLNDAVKISIVDPSLDAVGTYTDILMESVSDGIGNEISGNNLIQQSSEICSDFNLSNSRVPKLVENGLITNKETEDCDTLTTLRNVANSSSFNDGCCSYFHTDDHKSILDCALSPLPACYLTIGKLPLNKAKESEYGVFARKTIPKRTHFGPIEGVLMETFELVKKPEQPELGKNLLFLIETDLGQVQKLHISNENTFNWMNYVRAASSFKEQNLILNQQGQSLFFTTTKVIHPRQELRVWYSLPYARKHGLPSLQPVKFDLQGCGETTKTWSCFECNKNFADPVYLQCHLNVHELDKIKEVGDGKSAEKENHNLNQKNIPLFYTKKLKNARTKCESCVNECHTCNYDLQRKSYLKRCHLSHSKSRKYLCEVCGYQFSHSLNKSCHVRRRLKDTNMNDSSEQVPGFPRTKLQKLYSECRKNKNKTGWYCDHCNLTFDSPSIYNLHTLVHAAENLEEIEVITEVANDFCSVPRKGVGSRDLRCPKCTKKVETTDASFTEHGISKVMPPSHPISIQSDSLSEQQILLQSSANSICTMNEQTNFIETRIVDMNEAGFLTPDSADDHQLNSVLNSFKMEDKLTGALDLQDLSLTVQQPQTDLLEQTLLATPLNGDLTDGVVCFGHYDDVKISIVDPNMETVGAFTDILLEAACVGNTIASEITDSGLAQQSPEICSEFDLPNSVKLECQASALEDNPVQSFETGNNNTSNNKCFQYIVDNVIKDQEIKKSVLARVSASLPATYLTIKKLSHNVGEESGCGVFARKIIRRQTRFGPIQGILSRMSEICEENSEGGLKHHLAFLVETGLGKVHKLDVSRKNAFNWMRFVRVAQSCNERNVILSQQGQSLFFTTTKVIHPKEELRVWYSLVYAKRHGLPFLQPLKVSSQGSSDPSISWQCFECNEYFGSPGDLQYHLNIHDLDGLNENCSNQCRPCHLVHHNDLQKRQRPPYSRSRKYMCEFCGFQFSHSYSRDRHVQKYHKDLNVNSTYSCFPIQKILLQPSENTKNKDNSEWFCNHCNLTFSSASVCNLHTLVHAAENVEETEVITGVPMDFPTFPQKENDLRCPKCTKVVETSDGTSFTECGISTVIHESRLVSAASEEQVILSSRDSNLSYNLNGQTSFMETRIVGMDTTEFLTHNTSDDDQQLNSVLNSLKMQGLVIGEGENGDLQLHPPQTEDTCTEDKLAGALGLQELTLAVQQQQNDLLQQSLLAGPLNGDLSEGVSHLSQSLLNDNVKISIDDNSLESVGAYTDILMESACVESAIETEISENSLAQKSSEICSNLDQTCRLPENKSPAVEDQCIRSCELKDCNTLKTFDHGDKYSTLDGNSYSSHVSTEDKSVLAIASASLPAAYLVIRKLPHGKSVYGVFARKTLPKRTKFGPIEGVIVKNREFEKNQSGILEKEEDISRELVLSVETEFGVLQKLDVSSGNTSYWTRYIRTAPSFKEQNLVLNQQGQLLFFTTTKMIHPRQELRVWYSLPYANKRNLPLLHPDMLIRKSLDGLDKVWPCFECNEKFPSSEALQIHLNVHDFEREDEDSPDRCKMRKTNRSFRRKGVLNFSPWKYKINSDKQSEGFPYQCHTCNRAFPRNYSLKRHLLLHVKDKKYVCEVCGCYFSHVFNRDRHIRRRHKDLNVTGNSKLSEFLNKNMVLKSSSQNGNNACMEWYCSHCTLCFESLPILNLHTLSHGDGEHMLDNENLQCPQCSEEFITKKELIDHVADHGRLSTQAHLHVSSNPAKPWKCELCYKSFALEDRLQRHMLVHGAEESKPLQCDICCKRFLNNSALSCHIKIHTAEKKMFECPICKLAFEQVLSLKDHVHSHSENGVYTCPQCNKVFDGYSLIRKHIRAFHSDRKHTCNYCGKLFPKLDKLRMHMLRHSDHREFLCANCGKQFKRKDKLKEHMKRMHSAERELRLAMKPHRPTTTKKFMPKVSPTDYHRFIYKCHTCLLGFKRRGMLVNHLAKRHPDISPESVPELNLPILKTTRDYYCQYCEKIYKSSSKRKAHILKIHPGAELPMSNRRKGGVPEIPGLPNPTFSQTVGSISTHPHGCPWCHKQYASKAKLLQHQRKKHMDLLPQSQQFTGVDEQESQLPCAEHIILPQSQEDTQHDDEETALSQLQGIENVINIIPGDYHISTTEEDLCEFQETGIIIDTSAMERPLKVLPDGISADLLSQAMSELTNEFRVSVGSSPNDHYLRIVQTSPGHITVTQSPNSPESHDKDPLTSSTTNAVIVDGDELSRTSVPNETSPELHDLLSESYSLPSSPSSSPAQTWANTHGTYTPYTAR